MRAELIHVWSGQLEWSLGRSSEALVGHEHERKEDFTGGAAMADDGVGVLAQGRREGVL
jgi:hypothetical protein